MMPFSATLTTGEKKTIISCFLFSFNCGQIFRKQPRQREIQTDSGRNSLIDTKSHMPKHKEYQSHTHTLMRTHGLIHTLIAPDRLRPD